MLNSIKVKNFQSLRAVELELGRFTVILGESGTGKSAFIRSVLKLVRNDAVGGTSFGEDWSHLPPAASNAEVTLSVDEHTVKWVKGKDNRYIIDGEALNKVGKGCPDEVHAVLRMRELTFDGIDKYHLNFAQQFDMPFLLDDSGSKVAKILGEITNVNVLYAANRQANSLRATASKTLTVRKQDLEVQKGLLDQFSSLPADKLRLEQMLKLQDGISLDVVMFKELFSYQERLSRLIEQVVESERQLDALQGMLTAEELTATVLESLDMYRTLSTAKSSVASRKATEAQLKFDAKLLDPVRKVPVAELEAAVARYGVMDGYRVRLVYEELSVQDLEEALQDAAAVGTFDVRELVASTNAYVKMAQGVEALRVAQLFTDSAKRDLKLSEESLAAAQLDYEEFVSRNPLCLLCGGLMPHLEHV